MGNTYVCPGCGCEVALRRFLRKVKDGKTASCVQWGCDNPIGRIHLFGVPHEVNWAHDISAEDGPVDFDPWPAGGVLVPVAMTRRKVRQQNPSNGWRVGANPQYP
jgi:hypothetical protein